MILFWSNHLLFCRPDFHLWTLVVIQEQRKFHCQFQICELKKKKEAKRRKSPRTKFTFSIFTSWKSKTFDWRSTHTIRTSLCNIHISTSFNYHWISTSLICQILCWILEKHAHTKKTFKNHGKWWECCSVRAKGYGHDKEKYPTFPTHPWLLALWSHNPPLENSTTPRLKGPRWKISRWQCKFLKWSLLWEPTK